MREFARLPRRTQDAYVRALERFGALDGGQRMRALKKLWRADFAGDTYSLRASRKLRILMGYEADVLTVKTFAHRGMKRYYHSET